MDVDSYDTFETVTADTYQEMTASSRYYSTLEYLPVNPIIEI